MYRQILTTPIELTECVIKLKCNKCGQLRYSPEVCPVSGQRNGEGHEEVCTECRNTLTEVK